MNKKRVFAILIVSILCLLFLTGCVDEQMLDQGWLDRAHATINVNAISPYFTWVLWLTAPLMIFSFVALLRDDYISALHWFVIMVVGVGSFLRIVDVIQAIGNLFWPDGYTISAVMNWMGWQIPFPDDAVWTSPFAFAFTDLIPSLYSIWQWALIAIHGSMLVVVSFSRNLKPIWVDLSFIFSWAIAPSILALMTRAFAAAKSASSLVVTKAILETLYVILGFGTFLVFLALIPLAVGLAALFLPWGRLNYSWGKGETKENQKSFWSRVSSGLDRDAAAAVLGSLAGGVPRPNVNESGDASENPYAREYPMLPPGSGSEGAGGPRGPSDSGPNPSSPPSGRPNGPSTGGKGGEGNNEPRNNQTRDVVNTRETSKGVFEPLPDAGPRRRSEPPETPPTEVTGTPQEDDDGERSRSRLYPPLEGLGKTAKAAAPFVAPVNPEVGLALGLTGALLDRSGSKSQGSQSQDRDFPHLEDKTSGSERFQTRVEDPQSQIKEETFSPLSGKEPRESERQSADEDDQDLYPPLDRR